MSLLPWLDDSLLHHHHHHQPRYQVSAWRDPENHLVSSLLRHPFLEELHQLKSLVQDPGATVSSDKDKFQANFDVQQFKPEEISVKVTGDNTVTIEGKHEEKEDEHGYISRHFVRRYTLPENCDIKQVQSKLSSDGVLTITAPKIPEGKAIEDREIPIIRTGQPLKHFEKKPVEEAKK
ncbi:hypothetical protein NQ315_007096 [Exocentrus adspersus]|uniref:SHSP domain-containing protein n=1 Tax=Exocentrus adspersus TaxID=1586481 RepID=A0AAV8WDB2_9CUCU|nr:hypothetical protein NQ315_007096 [Exocentrus adspersus]